MTSTCGAGKKPTEKDIKNMQLHIDKLTIENKLIKKNIMKIYARIRSIKNGKIIHEKNEYRLRAMQANIMHMQAQIDGEYMKIEINKFNITALQNQLNRILALEPEPIVRREQLPPKASRDSPPLVLPPEPPRIANR
jgi:hypothetical protein